MRAATIGASTAGSCRRMSKLWRFWQRARSRASAHCCYTSSGDAKQSHSVLAVVCQRHWHCQGRAHCHRQFTLEARSGVECKEATVMRERNLSNQFGVALFSSLQSRTADEPDT